MNQIITGIQQVGIGVRDIDSSWEWYRNVFQMDIPVFDDEAEAKLMSRYTGGSIHTRRAVLALNLNGGGGFEIWQFKSRKPEECSFDVQIGDLGINAVKIKCLDIETLYHRLKSDFSSHIGDMWKDPACNKQFRVTDPHGNRFQILEGDSWFQKNGSCQVGGVCGAVIGVSNIDTVLPLYQNALGFNQIAYDESGRFEDLEDDQDVRRILIRKPEASKGAFSRLFGHTEIELIQTLDRTPGNIYGDRYWGDPGFIHLCFDVTDMDRLQDRCEKLGYSFTVNSASTFDMGDASGHFSYIEDPDGTLIEFVEAHKMPLIEKMGWYLNLKKRKQKKPLPDWMLKTMKFKRVKS